MRNYESEFGTKQSCSYEVRHFYKKLFFNPGIHFDENPFPRNNSEFILKNKSEMVDDFMKMQVKETVDTKPCYGMKFEDNLHSGYSELNSRMANTEIYETQATKGFNQVNNMFV